MTKRVSEIFTEKTVGELTIEDEKSFRTVGVYADLKEVLRRASYKFRVLADGASWDRALFLNLTFWGASAGGDVLVTDQIPADTIAHAAWHHLASRALANDASDARDARDAAPSRPSVEALFLGEAIASAFDVYLVGRLIGHAPRATFLQTQVPAMADAAEAAGVSEGDFEAMLEAIAAAPERAFVDLRELLSDATAAVFASESVEDAARALAAFDGHRFGPLLHRYELSNWVLYARAYGSAAPDPRARAIDAALREVRGAPEDEGAIAWLTDHWITPALAARA